LNIKGFLDVAALSNADKASGYADSNCLLCPSAGKIPPSSFSSLGNCKASEFYEDGPGCSNYFLIGRKSDDLDSLVDSATDAPA